MSKQIIIDVPEWVDEEKLRKAIIQAISQAIYSKELSIEEVRKMLRIKPEDLTEELEVEEVEELRKKEKERLKWLY
jgi:pyruvate-formate lyase-activating enzyme